jgi:hypothetical protein
MKGFEVASVISVRLASAVVGTNVDFGYSRLSCAAMPGGEFKQGRR